MSPDDSPNVVAYRVGELEKTVAQGFLTIHNKLDELRDGFVSHEQLDEHQKKADLIHAEQGRRIKKLEDNNAWVVRLVLTAVILSILAIALKLTTLKGV